MAIAKLYNLVRVTTTTPGTGTLNLGSAVPGYLSFADGGCQNGDVVSYGIKDGTASEVGRGTYNSAGPTLSRDTVVSSTNGNAAINLTGTNAEVFITPLVEDFDFSGNLASSFWLRSDVASAATCDIGAAITPCVRITGTTTITSFGTGANRVRFVEFAGSLLLTYNGTSLILPGTANIITQAGDKGIFVSDASGNWKCVAWTPLRFLPRETLTGSRTYYIRSDGSDANTGLANSSGGAFRTTQKAMDVVASLDISIYNVTIQCGDTGPFTGCLLKAPLGSGTVIINGDTANPSNYTFTKNGSSSYIFDGQSAVGKFQISGVHPHDSTAAYHIISGVAGNIIVANNNDYGDCTLYPLAAKYGGNLQPTGANNKLSCSGTITALFLCDTNSNLTAPSATTFTWLRNIAFGQFVLARWGGILNLANLTCALAGFTATGARYNADSNAVIIVGGGGASFFPGSTSGSTSNGGLYS